MLNRTFHSLALLLVLLSITGPAQVTVSIPEPHNIVVVAVPDKPAALQVDLFHLKLEETRLDSTAQRRRILANDTTGWTFSAFIYPLDQKLDSEGLRQREWAELRQGAAKEGYTIAQEKTYDNTGISMLEYTVPEFRGQRVNQKNVFGYIVSGDLGLDFHISKIAFKAEDQHFLDSFLGGVRLLENYAPDSRTEFEYGSFFYLQQAWASASRHYEQALENDPRFTDLARQVVPRADRQRPDGLARNSQNAVPFSPQSERCYTASNIRRSLTLFPVGPVTIASPSFSKNGKALKPVT